MRTPISTVAFIIGLTVIVFAVPFTVLSDPAGMTEKQKIESLISTVQDLKDATFIRNGTEYDCKAAADHMRTKWSYASDKIATARDFIRLVASKSSQSGKPYILRFHDGREVQSSEFLNEALDRLENPTTKPSTSPSKE